MAQIDTRHDERSMLFQMLVAQHNSDFDTLILNMVAKMEETDVATVNEKFEQWKKMRR
jgi:hypothetical protein